MASSLSPQTGSDKRSCGVAEHFFVARCCKAPTNARTRSTRCFTSLSLAQGSQRHPRSLLRLVPGLQTLVLVARAFTSKRNRAKIKQEGTASGTQSVASQAPGWSPQAEFTIHSFWQAFAACSSWVQVPLLVALTCLEKGKKEAAF